MTAYGSSLGLVEKHAVADCQEADPKQALLTDWRR